MRELAPPAPPACFVAVAASRPNGPWFDGSNPTERACRQATRKVLLENQEGTCGWCEARIGISSSHAEHIKPKDAALYPHLTFAIDNLIACCGKTNSPTCGHHKGNSVLAGWIHPYHTPDLEKAFAYEIDGKITPDAGRLSPQEQTEANDAIDNILNLNESVLKSLRESLIDEILNSDIYDGLTVDEVFTVVGEFRSVIEHYAP